MPRRSGPQGKKKVRVLGADETVFGVRGKEAVVGFVVDGQGGGPTSGFEELLEGDG